LLFQALDDKQYCVGIYLDGKMVYDHIPPNLTKTWSYSSFLQDKGVEFAQIYTKGKTLKEICPPQHQEEFDLAWKKMQAFYKSFTIAKIDLNQNCFFDLLPEQFVKDFCEVKNKITQHVFETYQRPDNYELQQKIVSITTEISNQRLNVNLEPLKESYENPRTREFFKRFKAASPYVNYNPFGTKTGRLTTKRNSFPILTMDKRFRNVLQPNNDMFVELDYNAAELRVLIGLLGMPQPDGDIHDWNIKNLYKGSVGRDQAKKNIFSWLYNPNSKDKALDKHYDRKKVMNKYWDGKSVKNYYKREIESDEYHSLNYIIQSTCSDLIMDRAFLIKERLQDLKSNIAFIIHDSVVLDLDKEDLSMINHMVKEFSNTPFGAFKVNVSAGKNFGEMKELCIQ
jgi:hypothetical protein